MVKMKMYEVDMTKPSPKTPSLDHVFMMIEVVRSIGISALKPVRKSPSMNKPVPMIAAVRPIDRKVSDTSPIRPVEEIIKEEVGLLESNSPKLPNTAKRPDAILIF